MPDPNFETKISSIPRYQLRVSRTFVLSQEVSKHGLEADLQMWLLSRWDGNKHSEVKVGERLGNGMNVQGQGP